MDPFEMLVFRLTGRGVLPRHIPMLVRNVMQAIREQGTADTGAANEHMEHLGWGEEVLDETSFQLIVLLADGDHEYRGYRP